MILPPPRSTHFPYTSLFLSHPRGQDRPDDLLHHRRAQIHVGHLFAVLRGKDHAIHAGRLSVAVLNRDRKSTRLNSSHSQISYAVFCLKKITPSSMTSSHRVC